MGSQKNKTFYQKNPEFRRIILLIMDGMGCGARPDYREFHPAKQNTLLSILKNNDKLQLPNLEKLGLNKIIYNKKISDTCVAGKMISRTKGNDTYSSIQEMLGFVTNTNRRILPITNGLNKKIISDLEKIINRPIIGNEYISGPEAVKKYYDEHVKTKGLILYSSADGAILITAHTNIIRPKKLYAIGNQLSKFLKDKNVSRIIARPFIGIPGKFSRPRELCQEIITTDDFLKNSIVPRCLKNKIKIITTPQIHSFLNHHPRVDAAIKNSTNELALSLLNKKLNNTRQKSLFIVCLQDFDTFAHRKNVLACGDKLKELDKKLPTLFKKTDKDDLIIIISDHGNDPTSPLKGHSREYVPLMLHSKRFKKSLQLGTRNTFADIGQTICHNFKLPKIKHGTAFEIQ